MPDYIHLIGAEDVRRAGATISGAATTMQRAASQIEDSLDRHRMFLEEWLSRFEAIIKEVANANR